MRRIGLLLVLSMPAAAAAQTVLQRAPIATATPAPQLQPSTFEADVGPFHVKSSGGRVDVTADSVTLGGEVTIYPNARPDLRVTLGGGSVTLRSAARANDAARTTYQRAARAGAVTKYDQAQVDTSQRDKEIASKQVERDALRRDIGGLEQRFAQNGKLTPAERQRLDQARAKLDALVVELKRMRGEDERLDQRDQFDTLAAQGTLQATLAGIAVRIPNASLALADDATLGLTGGDVAIKGCTQAAASGSRISGQELQLVGTLRCGNAALASTLKLSPTALSGSGTLDLAGHSVTVNLSAGQSLKGEGVYRGSSPGFQRVPGFDALEFNMQSPELRALIDGSSYTWRYSWSKLELRTVAARPDGIKWASTESSFPNLAVIPAPPAPFVPIPYPNLPSLGDPLRSARDACLAVANKVPDNKVTKANEHDDAVNGCQSANPQPPSIPTLPASVSVTFDKLIK